MKQQTIVLRFFNEESKHYQSQCVLDKRLEIRSKKRPRRVDTLLLDALPPLSNEKVLCLPGSSSLIGLALLSVYPELSITSLEFDARAFHKAQAIAARNNLSEPDIRLVTEVLEAEEPFDIALFPCSQNLPHSMTLEVLEQTRFLLKPRGCLYISTDADKDDNLRKALDTGFKSPGARILQKRRHGFVWRAVHKKPLSEAPKRRFRPHSFTVNEDKLSMRTRPGMRSHDRLSAGTKALMEGVPEIIEDPKRVLVFSAGAGLLALSLAKTWPDASFLLLTSSARDLDMCEQNRAQNSIENVEITLDTDEVDSFFDSNFPWVIVEGVNEHSQTAKSTMQRARKALSPSGCLIFAARDAKSWGAALADQWRVFDSTLIGQQTLFQARVSTK